MTPIRAIVSRSGDSRTTSIELPSGEVVSRIDPEGSSWRSDEQIVEDGVYQWMGGAELSAPIEVDSVVGNDTRYVVHVEAAV